VFDRGGWGRARGQQGIDGGRPLGDIVSGINAIII
jgi:hypothetical protein